MIRPSMLKVSSDLNTSIFTYFADKISFESSTDNCFTPPPFTCRSSGLYHGQFVIKAVSSLSIALEKVNLYAIVTKITYFHASVWTSI